MHTTRRQFMSGVAASLGILTLPRIALQPQYDLQSLLGKWCSQEPGTRYDLTAPYEMQGHAYATDARAMARIVGDGMQIDGTLRIPQQTVDVWQEFWHPDGTWRPLPHNLPMLDGDDGVCPLCLRRGVECEACSGMGEWCVLPGDRYETCRVCAGHGYKSLPDCPVCHGRHDREIPSCAVMDDKLIGLEYLHELYDVPDVQWNVGQQQDGPILWQSPIGIAGMIMPRRKP